MRAALYSRNGAARDVLELADLPDPEPAEGEVRVKLATSGVNPSDVKSRAGSRPVTQGFVVPHSDGAGVIDKVGRGVPATRVGERVWIWNGQWQRPMGSAAQFIVLPQQPAVRHPANVSFEDGARLGLPALHGLPGVAKLGKSQDKAGLCM